MELDFALIDDALAIAVQVLDRVFQVLVEYTRGEHLSGRGGASNEFSDYRDYAAGDDIRFVDWNIFARLRRPFAELPAVVRELGEAEQVLRGRGRVLLRYSGTEMLARVMVEGDDGDEIERLARRLVDAVQHDLG